MRVKVLYFAEFKEITGKDSEEYELTFNTLRGLIDLIIEKYYKMRDLIWDKKIDFIKNDISVIINNKAIYGQEILSTPLKNGDIIAFLFPVFGG